MDKNFTILNLTINASSAVVVPSGSTLTINGSSIVDNGQFTLSGVLSLAGSSVTLSGSGSLVMAAGGIVGHGTFVNMLSSSSGISGLGVINVGTLQNMRIINANVSSPGLSLVIIVESGSMTNTGTLESTGGRLALTGPTTYTNVNGSIQANGGMVILHTCTISGGTLSTSNGGVIEPAASAGAVPTLNGVTNTGTYDIPNGTGTVLEGTITNSGKFILEGAGSGTATLTMQGTVTLTGSGAIQTNGANTKIEGDGLVNQQTIQGTGGLINVTAVTNQGSISAMSSNNPLAIQIGTTFTNTGHLESQGGTLQINGPGAIANSGGSISSSNIVVFDYSVLVQGGSFGPGAGIHEGLGAQGVTLNGTASPVTIDQGATFEINAGDTPVFKGPIILNGTVLFTDQNCGSSCAPAVLDISGPVTLSATTPATPGTLMLTPSPGFQALITGATGSDALTNDITIEGTGTIGNNMMNFTNGAKGAIVPSHVQVSVGSGHFFQNSGLVTTSGTGILTVTGHLKNFTPTTGTFSGGRWVIGGFLIFDNANIVVNSANLTLAGGEIQNQSGLDALANFADNTGTFTLTSTASGGPLVTAGPFANSGKLTVAHGTTFMVGASGNYNQTAGTTAVDGVLEISSPGIIDITGGSLEGGTGTLAGATVLGDVSVGNPSGGAPATLIVGDSAKKPGLISISNSYTQLATGAMDVQIGGTTAGTKYSQLNVTGQVTLSGTLTLARINGFTPTVGETFTILTSSTGVAGTFSTVNGTAINATRHFLVSYTPNSVVVTVMPGP